MTAGILIFKIQDIETVHACEIRNCYPSLRWTVWSPFWKSLTRDVTSYWQEDWTTDFVGNTLPPRSKPNLLWSKVNDCYFLGVHIRLLTLCKISFIRGMFANYFFLYNHFAPPSKFIWLCLKVNWFVLIQVYCLILNYKFINRSFTLALDK